MGLFINITKENAKGPDMVGYINIVLEEKYDELDVLSNIEQLKHYYTPGTLFILLLRNIRDKEHKLEELKRSLNNIFKDGYIIAERKSNIKAEVVSVSIDCKYLELHYRGGE